MPRGPIAAPGEPLKDQTAMQRLNNSQQIATLDELPIVPGAEADEGFVIGALLGGLDKVPAGVTRPLFHSELYRPVFERCEQLKADGETICAESVKDLVPAPFW